MSYKYCPLCRSPLKRKGYQMVCSHCPFIYYNNPKPCVAAIVEQRGKILLAKRKKPPFKGWWDLPGGFIDYYEDPEEALLRELKEELGIEAFIQKPLKALKDYYRDPETKLRFSVITFSYLVKIKGEQKLQPADDVSEIKWFPKDNLPFSRIAFKNIRQLLKFYQTLSS